MSPHAADVTFGAWLRQQRRAADLTQGELAARVPCAKGTIRRIESDDLRPSKQLAARLAAVLEVPPALQAEFIEFARQGITTVQPHTFVAAKIQTRAEAPAAAPNSLSTQRYRAPAAVGDLIGRVHITGVATELLLRPDVRLVTLIGPPGVGKSRLALQVAGEVWQHFRSGVCFVALAPLQEAAGVLPAIAQALDLVDSGRPLAVALADRLSHEEMVLLLDNCEHVLAAAPAIAALLAAAPDLKVLCTSRVPLRITGEHEFVVPPLALPDMLHLPDLAALELNPAVALFVARARAVYPAFAVTGENAHLIAELCHRLDGLPLAIELAANRIKLFAPAALLVRLERRLPFLTGGARDAPARQRTLAAAIGWSYDLLGSAEQFCLARLGCFWGGWTLEAAEAVCGDELSVLDALAALVDHSLVQSEHGDQGDVRFSMFETIREFALMRLDERGERAVSEARHARFFLALACDAEHNLQGTEQVAWMHRLHTELYNLRAALAWSLSPQGDLDVGLAAGAALWWFWWTSGLVGEGRRWLQEFIARAAAAERHHTAAFARALLGAGILAFFAGEVEDALPRFEQARALGAAVGDTVTAGYATFMIGTVMVLSGDAEGHAILGEGHAMLRAAGEAATWHVGVTSLARTLLTFERGDLDAAQQYADDGMAIFRRLGQPYGIGLAFNYQGDVARLRGDYATAAARYTAALPLLRQANAKSEIPAVLHNLGHVVLAQGDASHAQALFTEGLALHRAIGNRMGVVECLIGLAATSTSRNEPVRAAMLLGAADALLEELAAPLFAAELTIYQHTVELTRKAMGLSVWTGAHHAGKSMPLVDVLSANL